MGGPPEKFWPGRLPPPLYGTLRAFHSVSLRYCSKKAPPMVSNEKGATPRAPYGSPSPFSVPGGALNANFPSGRGVPCFCRFSVIRRNLGKQPPASYIPPSGPLTIGGTPRKVLAGAAPPPYPGPSGPSIRSPSGTVAKRPWGGFKREFSFRAGGPLVLICNCLFSQLVFKTPPGGKSRVASELGALTIGGTPRKVLAGAAPPPFYGTLRAFHSVSLRYCSKKALGGALNANFPSGGGVCMNCVFFYTQVIPPGRASQGPLSGLGALTIGGTPRKVLAGAAPPPLIRDPPGLPFGLPQVL